MSHHQVIIIGGGMSGLSAYVKLLECGYKDVLLIEGSNRLGGRINTIAYENSFIELGAQWIHGTKGNPIYELSKLLGLVDDKKIKECSMHYATQDGTQLDETYVDKIFDKIENIFDNLDDLIENELDEDSNQNLGALIEDGFLKILKKLKSNDNANIDLIKAIYRARVNEEKYESSSDDLRQISAVAWNEYEDFDGDQFTRLKYGYAKLIEYLSSQIPKENLKLNQMVEKIDWSESNEDKRPIKLSCVSMLNHQRTTYTSDYVLCTASLGFLKKHYHTLFEPNLPLSKARAIENLGYGLVNKIFVCFDKPVLKKDYDGLKIFWRDDLEFKLNNSDTKWKLNGNTFFKALDNFEILPNLPNVFICFVVGQNALFIESLVDECLVDVISELFSKCFPQLNLPRPNKVLRSKWSQDPFANGSYTFVKTDCTVEDVKNLAQPLHKKLYFSGEGTTYKFMGTVHGAYISGRDAANKIIKAIKN